MTYSIVARDPATGQFGIAVQTGTFGVGRLVPWAIAGVGAVASQAMADPAYGPRCLDAMAAGATAADVLTAARALDPGSAVRQVGVVDAAGGADAFTGEKTIDHAGHRVGDGWTIQANMMANPDVWPAMADAYESASGPFGDRLLATLRAGEAAGGDGRGPMSAAMLIVDGTRQDEPWQGRLIDLRVDHNADDPIEELDRLYRAALAYQHLGRAVDTLMTGDATGAAARDGRRSRAATRRSQLGFPARRRADGRWRHRRRHRRHAAPGGGTPGVGGGGARLSRSRAHGAATRHRPRRDPRRSFGPLWSTLTKHIVLRSTGARSPTR